MTAEEIREGDIVEIDYIEEFTKEHINEGKALVIWKGFNHQPLVRKLNTRTTIWTCYEHIARVVGHIDIEGYMDKALEQQPVLDKIRAEIMQLDYDLESVDYDYNDMAQTEMVHMICREEVLQIIDKYKAESEDE